MSFDKQLADLQKTVKKYLLEKKLKESSAESPLFDWDPHLRPGSHSCAADMPCVVTLTHRLISQTDFRLSLSL